MQQPWSLKTIQQYIDDRIQESLILDYKAADSLQKKEEKKKEITKDISAMANSAGGIIIYGIKEYKDTDLSFYPEKIDPIDQSEITKEWLQQVINTIRPKIDGIIISPIQLELESKNTVYVVEIPQSSTAHQATDHRYYKRYNALSIPMDDYEIRDIMSRVKTPQFSITFSVNKNVYTKTTGGDPFGINIMSSPKKTQEITEYTLTIYARNTGSVVANYVNAFFKIPNIILPMEQRIRNNVYDEEGLLDIEFIEDNTVRDVVDTKMLGMHCIPKYGPSRYEPILPKLGKSWEIELDKDCEEHFSKNLKIKWELYADNANPVSGEVELQTLCINDVTKE